MGAIDVDLLAIVQAVAIAVGVGIAGGSRYNRPNAKVCTKGKEWGSLLHLSEIESY